MKVIYFCYGGAHSSVTCAAIHLGHLPNQNRPTLKEICTAPGFDVATRQDFGLPVFRGFDEEGRAVMSLALGPKHRRVREALQTLLGAMTVDEDYLLVNCLPCLNISTRLGGWLSRYVGLCRWGRPLAAWGVRRNYSRYLGLVDEVAEALCAPDSILDGTSHL